MDDRLPAPAPVREVRLRRGESGYTVEARIDGSGPVSLVLDTGATSTVLSPRVAERLGLEVSRNPPVLVRTAGGTVEAGAAQVREIEVGGHRAGPLQVVIHDAVAGADGLLGMNFLGLFHVEIRADGPSLILSPRDAPAPNGYPGRPSRSRLPRAADEGNDPMNDTVAVVLAAGKGTRMKSRTPKVLHPLLGRPLLHYPLEACRDAGIARIVVVVGHRADEVRDALGAPGVSFALQAEQRGTGHAVLCARPELGDFRGTALILCGDVPLVRPETLRRLLDEHRRSGRLVTVLSMEPPDPTGYGRLVRGPDGGLLRIVEEADASEAERAVREVNTGTYAVDVPWLWEALARIGTANRQGEHYLTDIVAAAASEARAGSLRLDDPDEVMGINSRAQLAEACSILRARINRAWMEAGVTLEDPASTWIETAVALEPDVTLGPACRLMGGTRVAEGARIDQGVVASDCEIGPGAHVKPYCVMTQARVGPGAEVGPFAHLRPGAVLEESSKVGNFVEMKKSVLGRGSKAKPPDLPGGHDGRREGQHRRRHHHLQLRRGPQAPHHHRRPRLHRLQHEPGGAGPGRGRCGDRGRLHHHPGRAGRRPWRGPARAAKRRALADPEREGKGLAMCGIVGYVGAERCAPILLEGLRRLEYRGYDSAGVAVVGEAPPPHRAQRGQALRPATRSFGRGGPDGHPGHRPHPLGHPRPAQRGERPPPLRGRRGRGAQRHHRELPGPAGRTPAPPDSEFPPRPTPR